MDVASLYPPRKYPLAAATNRRLTTVLRYLVAARAPPTPEAAPALCGYPAAARCSQAGAFLRSPQAALQPPAAALGSRRHFQFVESLGYLHSSDVAGLGHLLAVSALLGAIPHPPAPQRGHLFRRGPWLSPGALTHSVGGRYAGCRR